MFVEKRFRRCVDLCQRFLTPDDTHDLCVMCLGEEHARSVLEGMDETDERSLSGINSQLP